MKKHIRERQARHAQMSARDQARRCTFCRRELPKVGAVVRFTADGTALPFCDENCELDQADKSLLTVEVRR